MIDKGLTTYIAKIDREFVEQGGIKERMHAARTGYRAEQDTKMQHYQTEIKRLRTELDKANATIKALQAELARKG